MTSPWISSDILEQQFGPTALEVMHQNALTRIICTKATRDRQILEFSCVRFMPEGVAAFPAIHQAIAAGQSMGKTFRAAGVAFTRQPQSVFRQRPPQNLSCRFGSNDPATIVLLTVTVGPNATPYAQILETYSPAIIWPDHTDSTPTRKQLEAASHAWQRVAELLES